MNQCGFHVHGSNAMSFLLCLMFLFNKIGEQEDGTGSAQKQCMCVCGGRWPKLCIHM
jgi:hypothetical protein